MASLRRLLGGVTGATIRVGHRMSRAGQMSFKQAPGQSRCRFSVFSSSRCDSVLRRPARLIVARGSVCGALRRPAGFVVPRRSMCLELSRTLCSSSAAVQHADRANIKAEYVCKQIDIATMAHQLDSSEYGHWLGVDSLVVALSVHDYAAFFKYGAVVFFNCDAEQQKTILELAGPYCGNLIELPGTDDFTMRLDPTQQEWSARGPDHIVLRELNLENIRVISSVLAQSVALQHYEQQTLSMFLLFEQLHSDITEKSKGFFAAGIATEKRQLMFRILAESSSVMTEVIVKIGLLERTKMRETAWKYEQYFSLWEGLREEFELLRRWEVLQLKHSYIQQRLEFFVEELHANKGQRLEVLIVILIAAELGVSLVELGPHLLQMLNI